MITITVNGREEKVNIGCRTFVSLDVLLKIFESDVRQVTLNGESIHSHVFAQTTVQGGDTIKLAVADR
jgi:sulfur carrier protein ThiS